MPSVQLTTRNGSVRVIEASVGTTLMNAIRDAGVDELLALCGGCCSCATCHVYVDADMAASLPPPSSDEDDLLESSSHRLATSRLSCQLVMRDNLDGMTLTVAPED